MCVFVWVVVLWLFVVVVTWCVVCVALRVGLYGCWSVGFLSDFVFVLSVIGGLVYGYLFTGFLVLDCRLWDLVDFVGFRCKCFMVGHDVVCGWVCYFDLC